MKKNKKAWDVVQLARSKDRATAKDYIENIFTNFIEFHGDRYFGDDHSIIGGIAEIDGISVTVIAQEKGKTTEEKVFYNYGMSSPEGYRKSLRLMKQAEKFNRPIINIVDTPGAFPGIGAEERGQGEAIARNLMEASGLKVPIISIIIGEGGSGGALALAVGDRVWMMENAIYSILSPEGFASILWKDVNKKKEAAEIMKLTSEDLYDANVIDLIIEEPTTGITTADSKIFNQIKNELVDTIEELLNLKVKILLNERYKKYREVGR